MNDDFAPTEAEAFARLPLVRCRRCGRIVRRVHDVDGLRIACEREPDPAGDLVLVAWDARCVWVASRDDSENPQQFDPTEFRLRRHTHDD